MFFYHLPLFFIVFRFWFTGIYLHPASEAGTCASPRSYKDPFVRVIGLLSDSRLVVLAMARLVADKWPSYC